MSPCPTDLGLELQLLGAAPAEITAHVAACVPCRARLDHMRALTDDFRRFVYPQTIDRVLQAAEPRRWLSRLRRLCSPPRLAPLALAAAAALVLIVRPPRHSTDYVGTKGAPMNMTVFARTLDGPMALADGARVPPGTALRFQVQAPTGCRLWLVSVDEAGQVSRLYPTAGDGGADVSRAAPLPGGAILDHRTGPERLFAVCSPRPITYGHVERAARAAAAGGAERVRLARELPGLPGGALQTTLLIEKAR